MVPLEYEEEISMKARLETLTLSSLWHCDKHELDKVANRRGRVQNDVLLEITVILHYCR